jgi:TRAP-type C4-dicarboxylate transport system permease small subunit
MSQSYISFTDGLSRLFAVVSVILLIAAMLVVCEMIFLRYVFRAPTIWQTDFVVYSATAAIFLGAPYVLMTRGHVGIDILDTALPLGPRAVLRGFAGVLGFAFCATMFAASAHYFWEALSLGWNTKSRTRIHQPM